MSGKSGAADCGYESANEINADLNSGKEAGGLVGYCEGAGGAAVATLGELAKAGFTRRDDGDLCHGKESVGEKEKKKQQQQDE